MVIVIDAGVEVPSEFVARMASVRVPRVVGVPLINPLVEFRVSPAGSVPLRMLYPVGVFVEAIW